jgi:hypothetical protein
MPVSCFWLLQIPSAEGHFTTRPPRRATKWRLKIFQQFTGAERELSCRKQIGMARNRHRAPIVRSGIS